MTSPGHRIVLCSLLLGLISNGLCQLRPGQRDRSRGTFLGYFETLEHDVSGAVWALDDEWLHVEGFTYDGRGPDAFFWVGTEGDQASPRGHIVPFPSGASGEREMVLPAFSGENVLFRLPDGVKVSQLRWISVWCRRFTVNFGSFRVPPNLVLPKKRKLAELSRLAHAVRSGNVTLLDSKTIYIPNLHYDGLGPDAYFWVGKGVPDRSGRKIPNEKKSLSPLEAYEGVDIELVLPDNLTVYDIDYLALWCVKYTENFGDVKIPPASDLFLPPALGQTQVKNETGLQPLQPGAKDQYHTADEVQATTSLSTSSEPASLEHSTIASHDSALLSETSTQLPETTSTDSDKLPFDATENDDPESHVSLNDELSTTMAMTQTSAVFDFVTEDPSLNESTTVKVTTDTGNLVFSTTDAMLETTSDEQDVNPTEDVETFEANTIESEEELYRNGRQYSDQKMAKITDPNEIGLQNIGDAKQVMSSDFYLATPDKERNYVFRYGLAEDVNNIMVFDTNNTDGIPKTNSTGVVLGDFGGMPNDSLAENEFTFKYDADPEIKPVSRNESSITEILVHETEGRYRYSVGNEHAIQHVIDDVNFEPYGLVKIDSKKHTGAYFYGLPAHTDHDSESPEPHSHEEGGHHEEEVMAKHHPKDVYSVPVKVNLTDSETDAEIGDPNGEGMEKKNDGTEHPTEKEDEVTTKSESVDVGEMGDENKEHEDENKEKESKSTGAEAAAAEEEDRVAESKKAESAALPSSIPDLILLLVGLYMAVSQRI